MSGRCTIIVQIQADVTDGMQIFKPEGRLTKLKGNKTPGGKDTIQYGDNWPTKI